LLIFEETTVAADEMLGSSLKKDSCRLARGRMEDFYPLRLTTRTTARKPLEKKPQQPYPFAFWQ
jgi:hypothetical protein